MLSIALFSECYHPMRNGVVVSVDTFAQNLTRLGHHVTIFTVSHPDQPANEEGVLRFPSVMPPSRAQYPVAIPIARGALRQALRHEHFDVLHTHSLMMMGRVAVRCHLRRSIPLVFTYHTLIDEYTHYIPLPQDWLRSLAKRRSRDFANRADHVIVPGEHVADRLREFGVTMPITVIPTGINLEEIDQAQSGGVRAQYGIPEDVPLLVTCSRIAHEKNILRIIKAFKLVQQAVRDAHLLIIGGGPEESALRETINFAGLSSRIRMTGFVSRRQVFQGFHAADLFIFASYTETQGLVLAEAMATGLPVVAVASAAARETVEDGVEGLLTPDEDVPFAEAILSLLNDPTRCSEMRIRARKRAESFSAMHCTERLVQVYQQVIGGNNIQAE